MSTATRARLEDAIREHARDERGEGALVTDWVVAAATVLPERPDGTPYVMEFSDSPYHTAYGLCQHLVDTVHDEWGGSRHDDD